MNLDKVIFLFCTAQQVEFEEVVDKLHLMMDKSLLLVKARYSSRIKGMVVWPWWSGSGQPRILLIQIMIVLMPRV